LFAIDRKAPGWTKPPGKATPSGPMSFPERLAGLTLGFLACDADVVEQPILEVQQSLSLLPAIMHSLEDLHPSEGGWHAYSQRLDDADLR
jgi:hypothetical protein